MKNLIIKSVSLALVTAVPLGLTGCAQSNAQSSDRFAKVEIKVEKLADGVAVLFGAGGNIGVSYGPDGTVSDRRSVRSAYAKNSGSDKITGRGAGEISDQHPLAF